MSIDWITVSAQIINFLVLVALLRRFLYRPVLEAMQRRETLIANGIQDAKQREIEARTEKTRWLDARQNFADEREALRSQTEQDCEDLRKQLHQEAQLEFDKLRAEKLSGLEQEIHRLQLSLQGELAEAATDAARRALADLADETLEQRMIERFLRELRESGSALLPDSIDPQDPVTVITAHSLDAKTRDALTKALHKHSPAAPQPEFTTDPELICGLELSTSGSKLGWTIKDYFDDLSERLRQTLSTAPARSN